MYAVSTAEDYLQFAIEALTAGDGWQAALDALPLPIYVTDAQGVVTFCNCASAEFVGRSPEPGQDRWCIAWRLCSTNGDPLPDDRCPLAEAINKKVPIRGRIVIAVRPDGTRAAYRAHPTPLFDGAGNLTGAINLLLDVSDEQAEALSDQSARCRRLSQATHDRSASRMLEQMAHEYADTAETLRKRAQPAAEPSILSGGMPTIS